MTGSVQSAGQAYEHGRAVGVARGERVRVIREVFIKVAQGDAAVGSDLLQHPGRTGSSELRQGSGERGGDAVSAFLPFLGRACVAGPAHWPGRRIVVRRTCGKGRTVSPTALLTWVLTV